MRNVGINLIWLRPGKVGGSEEYCTRLLRAFPLDSSVRLTLFCTQDFIAQHPQLIGRYNTVSAPVIVGSRVGRIASESTWLAWASRSHDLVHHMGGTVPPIRTAVPLVTIHDLQPIELPQHFSSARKAWLRSMLPLALRSSRRVITPSAFTAARLQELMGVPEEKLAVISQGAKSISDVARDDSLKEKFGRFVLYPAISYPHKRHKDALRSMARLPEDVSLVLTGSSGPLDDEIANQASDLGVANRVHVLGRVSDQQLNQLYASALALLFPSEYEGFGNPVLEAMTRGCPVITSNIPALREVAGGASLTFEVGDTDQIAAAINKLITEPELRAKLVSAGYVEAQRYEWEASGKALEQVYLDALDNL